MQSQSLIYCATLEMSKAIQPGGQHIWPLVKPGILEIHPEFRGSDYTIGASFQLRQQNDIVHHQQMQVYCE